MAAIAPDPPPPQPPAPAPVPQEEPPQTPPPPPPPLTAAEIAAAADRRHRLEADAFAAKKRSKGVPKRPAALKPAAATPPSEIRH